MTAGASAPADLSAFAAQLADAARRITLAHFRRPLAVRVKRDKSPVTDIEKTVEETARALIAEQRPADGFFGEESGGDNTGAEYVWVVDPVDGTLSFISGSPLYCTLIGLAKNGAPLAGVIDAPALNERWTGGMGAAPPPAAADAPARLSDAVLATTTLGFRDNADDMRLRRLKNSVAHARVGGDAFNYGCLAAGFLHIAVDYQMKPCDYVALAPVVAAAGGVISDWRGAPLAFDAAHPRDAGVIAAATPALHAQALDALNGA